MKSLLLIAVTILAVGCGGKDESTTETKPVEEKVLEVKEEAKTEEPLADTKPKLEGVNKKELEPRGKFPNFIYFIKGSDTPYTGKSYGLYLNGQKKEELNYKDGKRDGLRQAWHKNGQKSAEANFKDNKAYGLSVRWHENGQKKHEVNYKDGRYDGLRVGWHSNGNKFREENWKDGELISEKWWNNRGEPVDSYSEAIK